MPRVIHFEITADDPERAVRFYGDIFGWKTEKWEGPEDYWLTSTGENANGVSGIDGGFMQRCQSMPQGIINTIDVPDLDAYIGRVCEHGGEIVMPKHAIPGVGWFAYAKDTEGNVFGMMQGDPAAAETPASDLAAAA